VRNKLHIRRELPNPKGVQAILVGMSYMYISVYRDKRSHNSRKKPVPILSLRESFAPCFRDLPPGAVRIEILQELRLVASCGNRVQTNSQTFSAAYHFVYVNFTTKSDFCTKNRFLQSFNFSRFNCWSGVRFFSYRADSDFGIGFVYLRTGGCNHGLAGSANLHFIFVIAPCAERASFSIYRNDAISPRDSQRAGESVQEISRAPNPI
jgi:hypothetical protein